MSFAFSLLAQSARLATPRDTVRAPVLPIAYQLVGAEETSKPNGIQQGAGATRTALIADIADDLMEKIRASIPKVRFGEVDDIVPSYVFLASDQARFYQGQCIGPNGGDISLQFEPESFQVYVPKTSSALMRGQNRAK